MRTIFLNSILLLFVAFFQINCTSKQTDVERIRKEPFGKAPDGTPVELFTLTNKNGMSVQITNYGGIITTLRVPDAGGDLEDVVLGYYTLEKYLEKSPHFGALVGRYGNRIAHGEFTLDGKKYELVTNNGPNHLHGGKEGFDKKVWEAEMITKDHASALKLHYLSPHMEEGYPGNLDVYATYRLTDENEVRLDFEATTDRKTILNLTHHSYFNLKGHGKGRILDHLIRFDADRIVPIDDEAIPLGGLMDVEGTPFDFKEFRTIGEDINDDHIQIRNGSGYDHTFVINGEYGRLRKACTVKEPASGRIMEVYTTEPGVQFYTGNHLDGSIKGKEGRIYERRSGFCLEAQHFPDSPHNPDFPSTVLEPGETYTQTTVYKFSTE